MGLTIGISVLVAACGGAVSRDRVGSTGNSDKPAVSSATVPAALPRTGPGEELNVTWERPCGPHPPTIDLEWQDPDRSGRSYTLTYGVGVPIDGDSLVVPLPEAIPTGEYRLSGVCDQGDYSDDIEVFPPRVYIEGSDSAPASHDLS